MNRHGEQQVGITGNLTRRIATHKRAGWADVLDTQGPMNGWEALRTENRIKKWLKQTHGTLPGTTEAWSTANLEVHSLDELIALADGSRNKKRTRKPLPLPVKGMTGA